MADGHPLYKLPILLFIVSTGKKTVLGFAYPLWLYEEDCTRSQATEKAQRVRFQADMKSPACASQEEKNKPVDLRLSQPGEVSAAAVHSNSRRRDCGRSFLLQAIAVRPTTQTCQVSDSQYFTTCF
ncbi:hypothetical protein chiPu_0001610 [Chiloscyllium punctatum]|uniref:Uncharacterized protein n=1 Tax=Chiloscyllium punctatum TaxID=137246 RepID=A0A401RYJ7_CHIPU|nr:hypothetical protein [Chiloscyllium punctatum]